MVCQSILKNEYPTYLGKGFFELEEFLDENGKYVEIDLGLFNMGYKYNYNSTDVTVMLYQNFNLFDLGNEKISLKVESDTPSKTKKAYEILDDKLKTLIKTGSKNGN